MSHIIVSVDRRSPAEKAGIRAGDRLTHINGEPVIDFLDYQALSANRKLCVRVLREAQPTQIAVNKGEYEALGLNFSTPMMSGVRMCCNHCLFCFVDQLPEHVRPSMRVKDDDWRMSLMMGNYVTLTNVSDRELDRIAARHASPLYISVHAIDPELRVQLLRTPRAAKMREQLKRLNEGGIEFHCQAVLCPGLNDGEALEQTIRELSELEGALSLALVPVGLTNHREGLTDLRKYTRDEAREVIEIANRWREKLLEQKGTRFVFPSDEFYLQAELPIPADEEYEDYGQIDDGVGLLRLLDTEFKDAYSELDSAEKKYSDENVKIAVACGVSAAPFLRELLQTHPIKGAEISVHAVENTFFGSNVTVSGLITGGDLVANMQNVDSACILITECMLRNEGDRFLDDMPIEEAEKILQRPIIPVGRRGDELLEAILSAVRTFQPEHTN